MAEEGCGHSQVALAKQFLSENSGESDQIAIHWLIKVNIMLIDKVIFKFSISNTFFSISYVIGC